MRLLICCLAFPLGTTLSAIVVGADSAPQADEFQQRVQPILSQFCYRCHGPEKQEADLRLDTLDADLLRGNAAETWHDVLNRLNLGEMPPEDEPQPTDDQREGLVGWLTGEFQRLWESKSSTGGRTVLRRLTRYEYQNTMRELIGLDLSYSKDLPPESFSKDGFKNNGAVLGMSPLQLEFYLEAARTALRKAIVVGDRPQVYRYHITESDPSTKPKKIMASNRVGPDAVFLARMMEFPREGDFLVRVKASAIVPDGMPAPRMRVTIGVRSDVYVAERTVGEVDVLANQDSPEIYEFRGRIEEFPLPGHNPKFPGLLVTVNNDYESTAPKRPKKQVRQLLQAANVKPKRKKKGEPAPVEPPVPKTPTEPTILVDLLEFEGPLADEWPPPSHTRILPASSDDQDERAYARDVLARFMRRAFRRPVTKGEIDEMLVFFDNARPRCDTFEETMREVLALVLISPDFLYLVETRADDEGRQPLDAFELASRLSYFLWSSMPDEKLLELAESGRLLEPGVLTEQTRSMIADPRSQNFVDQFATQWLDLSSLDRIAVNPEYYPDFDDRLKQDMRQETLHFVAEILHHDLSCLNFLESDFAMLSKRLAQHYGIEGPESDDFERVRLRRKDRRGGLLTQGSMLLGNSTGEDSHPIRRAVWIRERLLDDPPAPPPPDVPELNQEDADFARLSLRRQLELHRTKAACNSCHRNIDPWGIPLEQYDATGRWRTEVLRKVPKKKDLQTAPVESSTTLPDGTAVDDLRGLKAYLRDHQQDRFARALVRKLLAYSLGRSLEFGDEPAVDALTQLFAANDYRLSDLITGIVRSEPFMTK